MDHDLTQESVDLFNDPAAWDTVVTVPIFVPHRVKHDGDKEVVVDKSRLEKIADKINRKFEQKGVAVVFTEGHRIPDPAAPEKNQPAILSYGKDAKVGAFNGKPALLIRQYVRKGCLPRCKELPFRSAEFYDDSDEITGVALLRRDPKLDMGMVFYSKSPSVYRLPTKNGPLCCYLENAMPDPTADLLDQDKDKDMGTDPDQDADFDKKADAYMGRKYPHFPKMYEENCSKYMAMPSATNGSMPMNPDDKKDPVQFQRTEAAVQYQKQIAAKDEEIARLMRRMDYARELTPVVAAAYKAGQQFDLEAELDYCVGLTPEQFRRHKTLLYQAGAPTGGNFVPTAEALRQDDDMDEIKLEKVTNYMRANRVDFHTAKKAVFPAAK